MKKIMRLLCALMVTGVLACPGGVFAESGDMNLNTQVPDEHTVSIESPDGRIAADGVFYETEFSAERHSEVVYTIIPDPGKQLKQLIYAGEDVTDQVENGVFKAPKLVRDTAITAVYEDAPQAPDERVYTMDITVMREADGKPAKNVTVTIGDVSAVTNGEGKATLEKISSGTHQVIVTDEDGVLLGHMELTINAAAKSSGAELSLSWDEDGNPVITPASRTSRIALTLWLTSDDEEDGGRIIVKAGGVTDVTPWPALPGDSSKTGDETRIALLALLAVLAAAVGCGAAYRRRRS